MTNNKQTFSESWHRIGHINASLKSTVKVHKQYFRGDWWYVLQDPFNNRFFRVPPQTYRFVARLSYQKSIDQVWQECLNEYPDETPGQQEVIQLLTQLHHNSLLHYNSATDNSAVFERQEKLKKRELRSKLLSFMFIRIPLFDPDQMLQKVGPFLKPLFTVYGLILWLAVVIWGGAVAIEQTDSLLDQSNAVLAPGNLLLLYLGMALVKTLHELGHAFVCRHFSGEVHTLGVMLIIFVPLPYMDATSSWSFRQPLQRVFVGAAGIIVELFIAAVAILVWANTGAGTVNSLAYNIIFIASLSTLLFNANPLLRFDAYYMLSDALDIPNLYQRSRQQVVYLIERFVFGCQQLESTAHSVKEAFYLVLYAILSSLYRIVVVVGIILFVADKYLLLGLLMALFSAAMWLLQPPVKLVKYLATNQRIARRRNVAIYVSFGFIIGLVLALSLIPLPDRIRVPGVIESVDYTHINTQAAGRLIEILAPDGSQVSVGTPLLRFENKQLTRQIKLVSLQLEENHYQQKKARDRQSADLAPLQKQQQSLQKRLVKLKHKQGQLRLKAPISGIWSAPKIKQLTNTWVERGATLGTLYSPQAYRFSAVVLQDDNARLFQHPSEVAEVRIHGQEGVNIQVRELQLQPFHNEKLPSAALGWQGGGELGVQTKDQTGTQSREPFFQLHAELPGSDEVQYFHGVSGVLRISLTPTPLLWQWYRQFRQLLQKRYQL